VSVFSFSELDQFKMNDASSLAAPSPAPAGPHALTSHSSATANTPARKLSKVSEAVIRIAGNSQDGIQAIGGFLARLAGRSEQEVMTFMTIPSTISGGPSIFQVRIGSGEVLSSGDDADMLVAFYQHSYEDHINSVREGGIVLYDSAHVTPKPEWEQRFRHLGINITGLTVEAIGGTAKDKGKNIYTLGLIAKLFDLNVGKLEKPSAAPPRTRARTSTPSASSPSCSISTSANSKS
jgi:2-oxoglutarate/2-oxoacid ferredoxin oxidoreductase subunit alpha